MASQEYFLRCDFYSSLFYLNICLPIKTFKKYKSIFFKVFIKTPVKIVKRIFRNALVERLRGKKDEYFRKLNYMRNRQTVKDNNCIDNVIMWLLLSNKMGYNELK